MENKNNKFLEGAVIGAILGVAAGIFLTSKKGKELTENVKDMAADFYKKIAPKLKSLGRIGEKEYKEFMKEAAENYAKAKDLSSEKAQQLVEETQKTWKQFQDNL